MNKRFEEYVQSRRQFFIGAARCASLGLLCAGGGLLLAKRRRLIREGVCISDGLCEGCEIFEKCRLSQRWPALPSALPAKQIFDRVDNG
jgi:hypothetical protein